MDFGEPGMESEAFTDHHLNSHNRTGGVAQVVECLLSKCEVPSANRSPTKKKKK
jgi:hypothetical protein